MEKAAEFILMRFEKEGRMRFIHDNRQFKVD